MLIKSIEAVLILFILILLGWLLSRINWIKNDEKVFLNKIIVKICIPALAVHNLFSSFSREFINSSLKYLFVAFIFFIVMMIVVVIIVIILKLDKSTMGSFAAMSIVSNSMFFGLPINLSLYGQESLQYILCYFILNTIIFWSICAPMIKKEGNINSEDTLLSNLKNILNVPFITIIVSSILIYNSVVLPSLVLKVSQHLSNLVTPLACIVIGKIIYDIDLKKFRMDSSMLIVMIIRFIISPLLMFSITRLLGLPIIVTKVFTIMAAMPIMMQVAIVTDMYGGDSEYVTSGIALTTLLTLLTTPVYSIIMDMIL
ncbi:MAG: hypothetical protein GX053_03220 [Tissierella sp.]|nr:hypothetical protein [Tissierella sp.]